MPNLEWVQSTSPNPGADHQIFWGVIRPVDDEFWNEHRPGDRWNCKCELRQTDAAPTIPPMSDKAAEPQPGLENNTGKDGNLFSQEHPYYPDGCISCPFAGGTLRALYHSLAHKQDCHNCQRVDRVIDRAKDPKTTNHREYEMLRRDSDYTDVHYDKKSGDVMATHIGHAVHSATNEPTYWGVTTTELEQHCQQVLFKKGHSVLMADESKRRPDGTKYPALDLLLNGRLIDIASITRKRKHFRDTLLKKDDPIVRFNSRADVSVYADSLCLYFERAD